jgi:acyl dehydratase
MTRTEYFEDYVVGAQRVTSGRTVTETDVVIHAGHTGDYFPHHVDAEFARRTQFGQRIAHGTMTFAIGIGLTASQINPVAFTYGYDKCVSPSRFSSETRCALVSPSRKCMRIRSAKVWVASWRLVKC